MYYFIFLNYRVLLKSAKLSSRVIKLLSVNTSIHIQVAIIQTVSIRPKCKSVMGGSVGIQFEVILVRLLSL